MSKLGKHRIPGYRIERVLGDGAMAIVYRAVHEGLKKPVALKVLHEPIAKDPEYRLRFLREGKAAARLNHPNVVRAYEAGEHAGTYYFAMELVEGEDLSERLGRRETLPEEEALRIGVEVARALEAAEAHGMLHRDVKPENVLLGKRGQVKLADLGLAKIQGDGSLTTEGFTLGTVAFFSPEQCRGTKHLDIRSDLYALGALLYNTLCGVLPHGRGENPVLTMERILQEEPRDLAEAAPGLSLATVEAVKTLMSKDAAARPASARDAVELLEDALSRLGEEPAAAAITGSAARKRIRRRRRRPVAARRSAAPMGALVVVAACVGVAVALYVLSRRGVGAAENQTKQSAAAAKSAGARGR